MAASNAVFTEDEVICASREPAHTASANTAESGMHHRAGRRPRKVVVYYFDSDAEGEEMNTTVVPPRERFHDNNKNKHEGGGAGKTQGLTGPSDNTTPATEKLDCPGIEDLEAFSNDNASSTPAGVAVDATCGCRCSCQSRKPVSVDNPRIGSPTPIGFFAFGITTLLYNVHTAKICQLNMATMGLVVAFGGLTQFLCGFFELINMNTFGCTVSASYGAFWLATAVLFLQPENAYVTMGDHTYSGGFFFVWFIFASTLFASSFRSPFMCMALFFLVPLNFLLQSIGSFADSIVVAKVAGYEGIIVGALATYLGMAFTLRDVYGRSLLPILFQKNMRYAEW